MSPGTAARPSWATPAALVALAFGALTIFAGGRVLFGPATVRATAGNYVPFVLWFNFFAGFAYMAAGAGLWRWQRWAVWLALGIAAATLLVFAAFGMHIVLGGAFEPRTVAAMTLRTVFWAAIATLGLRALGR